MKNGLDSINRISSGVSFAPLLLLALLFASCGKDDGPKHGSGAGKNGFLTVEAIYENSGVHSRNDAAEAGIAEEGQFNSAMFVLYDAASGKSVRIDSYTLADDGTVLTATDSQDYLKVTTDSDGKKHIRKLFDDIPSKDYYLTVILNSGLAGYNLDAIFTDDTGTETIRGLLTVPGHGMELLARALELTQYRKGAELIDKGVGMALTGMNLSFPSDINVTSSKHKNDLRIVMSNADGLVKVTDSHITGSRQASGENPVGVKLERAVAKVAVFRSLDHDNLSHGAQVRDFKWACDIINNHTYLLRQAAPTAPQAGGQMEHAGTDNSLRYATDPNYDGYSNDRRGQSSDLSEQFFMLDKLAETDIDLALYKTWNTVALDSEASEWTAWEYVTENTMAAGEQYEDVTTRIVIRCNYIPGSGNSISAIQPGDSYYHFNGLAIGNGQMKAFYSDPTLIPDDTYPQLAGLEDLLADVDMAEAFGWPGTFDSPTESRSVRGIDFFRDGVNYYKVLIRHFDNALSPQPMGYGRYGVVRNNVYKIIITDINGPGSIGIPEPEGPDDKDGPVKTEFVVMPWNTVGLIFDI